MARVTVHARTTCSDGAAISPGPLIEGMVRVPGGTFLMGADDFYPEERPAHLVTVDGFWMDERPVTNADFRRFVDATGHFTAAERPPDPADYPGVDAALLVPGSHVFRRPLRRVGPHDFRRWWVFVPGACWKRPEGTGRGVDGLGRYPTMI